MLGYVFETFENIVKYLMPLEEKGPFFQCGPWGVRGDYDIRYRVSNRSLMNEILIWIDTVSFE